MAKHVVSSRERVYALWKSGMSERAIASALKGLVDRTTVQAWIKACRESDRAG